MTKILSFLAAGLLLATAALAQDSRDDRLEAARSYVQSTGQQQMLDQLLSPDVASAQIAAQFPQVPVSKRDELATIIAEEMGKVRPAVEAAIVEAAAEVFTTAEIKALDAFYRTDEGAAVLAKMQPFMQSSLRAMGPSIREAQGAIARRVRTLTGQ